MSSVIVSLIEGNSSLKEQVEREKPEDVPEKPGIRWLGKMERRAVSRAANYDKTPEVEQGLGTVAMMEEGTRGT